jgi:hypothetical protein
MRRYPYQYVTHITPSLTENYTNLRLIFDQCVLPYVTQGDKPTLWAQSDPPEPILGDREMKQVTSAILLLVASTLAAAVEPVSGTNQSLVVAYNNSQASNNVAVEATETEALASKQETKRVLEKTLDVVSAQLSVEIETPFDKQFIARN